MIMNVTTISFTQDLLTTARHRSDEAIHKNFELEKKMSSMEKANHDLQDQIFKKVILLQI